MTFRFNFWPRWRPVLLASVGTDAVERDERASRKEPRRCRQVSRAPRLARARAGQLQGQGESKGRLGGSLGEVVE